MKTRRLFISGFFLYGRVRLAPHPTFPLRGLRGHPPQIRKRDCTGYFVHAVRIWRGRGDGRFLQTKNGLGRNVNETVVLNGGFYFMFSSAQGPSNDSLKYPSKILSSDAGRTFCFHSRNSLPPSCPEQYTNLAFVFCSASQMWLS